MTVASPVAELDVSTPVGHDDTGEEGGREMGVEKSEATEESEQRRAMSRPTGLGREGK